MPKDRDKYRFLNSKYKDLNFVQRGLDMDRRSIPYGDKQASHRLAAEVDENGQWMVFPTIVEINGELREMDKRRAMAYAKESGEYIPFENKDDAIGYSKQGLIIHGGENEGMPVGSLTNIRSKGLDMKNKKKYLQGGSIGGILQTIGGIGAMATGVGAGVGVPMIAGGIGRIASAEMAAANQQEGMIPTVTPQNILNAQQQQVPQMQDGGVMSGQKNMPMKNAVTQYKGGNGKPDSIELGDVAMVDDGEVRVGDYIFSNHLKFDKENTFSNRVKSILKKYGWDEKKEEFKRPQDNATRNSLERELSGIIEKQEEKRIKKQESDDKRKMKYGGYIKKEYQDGGEIGLDTSMGGGFSDYNTQMPNLSNPQGLLSTPQLTMGYDPLLAQMGKDEAAIDRELANAQTVELYDSPRAQGEIPKANVNPLYSALGQVGNIYNVARGLSGAEDVGFERVNLTPEEVSFASGRRAIEREGVTAQRGANRRIAQTARSAGQAMSNIGTTSAAISGSIADALSQSYQREGNINAQMRQQASMREDLTNVDIANQEKIAEQQNRAAARNAIATGLSGIGLGAAQYGRDVTAAESENIRNKWILPSLQGSFFRPTTDEDDNLTYEFIGD